MSVQRIVQDQRFVYQRLLRFVNGAGEHLCQRGPSIGNEPAPIEFDKAVLIWVFFGKGIKLPCHYLMKFPRYFLGCFHYQLVAVDLLFEPGLEASAAQTPR